jgi:hypothetical protein
MPPMKTAFSSDSSAAGSSLTPTQHSPYSRTPTHGLSSNREPTSGPSENHTSFRNNNQPINTPTSSSKNHLNTLSIETYKQ